MQQSIFRPAALAKLASPEQLDQLMKITSPRGWMALGALMMVLAAALLWGIFGTITTTVEGPGILLRPGGLHSVASPRPGVVRNVLVFEGDEIQKGTVMVRVSAPDKGEHLEQAAIESTCSGRVVEVLVKEGAVVERGTVLAIVEPTDVRLEAMIYVPLGEGRKIQPGMRVEVTPSTVKKKEIGFIVSHVGTVAAFPATRQGMMRNLENEELVRTLSAAGPSLQIVADLVIDPSAPSGYQWSSSKGPPFQITSGTPCRATVTVREQRPISLLIPTVRDLLGL